MAIIPAPADKTIPYAGESPASDPAWKSEAGVVVIPLTPVASQIINVTLGSQGCQIRVQQKEFGVRGADGVMFIKQAIFLDLYVNDALIIGGVMCLNEVPIVQDAYLGFDGDLMFHDTQRSDDPYYTGLGTRYLLAYHPASA